MKSLFFLILLLTAGLALAESKETFPHGEESSPLMMMPRGLEKASPKQRAEEKTTEQVRRERSNAEEQQALPLQIKP